MDLIGNDKGNFACNEGGLNKIRESKGGVQSEKKKIKKGSKKASDVFICAVCSRMIKRNSISAHNKTRVHVMNVKMMKK